MYTEQIRDRRLQAHRASATVIIVRTAQVTVLGAGVAGLATALLLAREGHHVAIIERDPFEVGASEEAPRWQRKGIPHFLQPHAFIPRGRAELATQLPDVYSRALQAGAYEVDVSRKLPGPPLPGDEALRYLAVRRPLMEWALRDAVREDPLIDVRSAVSVRGLRVEGGRVAAVKLDQGEVEADLTVDALGRRSPIPAWLSEEGVTDQPIETSDCGVVYYSRYYRVRPGFDLPEGPWILSPRGDLGYSGYASFPGDNGTFAAILAVPTGVAEWRILKDAAAFEAAVAQIPALRQWADPVNVEPITDVLPMAGLRNTLRPYDPGAVLGLVPVGDAYSHTDPVLAHGVAFALIHAGELAAALREHDDLGDAGAAYAAATAPALRERYQFATALDDQRHRMWMGESVDFTRHDGDYALFSMAAAGAAATVDPDIFRMFVRRIGLLDSTTVLDADVGLQHRIEDVFSLLLASPRAPAGPPREEMLAATAAAAGS